MTQASTDLLKRSLDQVDRERKRARLLLLAVFVMSAAFWVAMMFSKDDHTALPYGLAAIIGNVYVAAMSAAKVSHENTRAVLKAIELLAKDE